MEFVRNYSDKSFAVVGDTIDHKGVLRGLGGKYSQHLRGGGGWVFSKNTKDPEQVWKVVSALGAREVDDVDKVSYVKLANRENRPNPCYRFNFTVEAPVKGNIVTVNSEKFIIIEQISNFVFLLDNGYHLILLANSWKILENLNQEITLEFV